jgi:restriction system protein
MLEHLNSREFEESCQLLLTCHYRCKVVLTKQTGDEGRDLLVYHSSGLEVVECKHWPSATVGRPVVQKLHSAILTASSNRGSIITTGRFSNEAETYAQNLNDVKIELIDAAKLAYLSSMAFPNGALPTQLSAGIKTTPDAEFPTAFAQSIFSKSRYQSGGAAKSPVGVTRITEYETYFIATYHAEGTVSTAAGEFSKSWDGSIWIRADGERAGFGSPRSHGRKIGPVVPLAEVLRTVPGQTAPPKLQPHQAVAGMKNFIVDNCVKLLWYRGRNNRNYTATIQPSPNTVVIDSLTLCYVPFQQFVLEVGGVRHEGEVDERGSPSVFYVTCPSLSKCTVCGTATTADSQVFCSICSLPAHRQSIFFPDSFQCQKCGDITCRKHTVQVRNQMACTRCCKDGQPLGARWLRHCQFGLAASTLIGLSTAVIIGCLRYFGSGIASAASPGMFALGLAMILAMWIPFLCMIVQPSILRTHKGLTYRKVQAEKVVPNRPDWLYGNKT